MKYDLEFYWESIPVGKQQAVSYVTLEHFWEVSERQVRKILEHLSCYDNGDNYILIRSSRGGGFYRTADPDDIATYKRECYGRAMKVLAPIKKINRVLRAETATSLNYSLTNNIKMMRLERGLTQAQLCACVQPLGINIDESTLSKFENGYVLPTPAQLSALAFILSCDAFELLDMQEYQKEIKIAQSSLQVS